MDDINVLKITDKLVFEAFNVSQSIIGIWYIETKLLNYKIF